MSNVTAALPRKSLTAVECKFLKVGNRMLLEQNNGRIASAALMDIVADWHAARATWGSSSSPRAGSPKATPGTNTLTSCCANCSAWTLTQRPGGLHEETNLRGQGAG